MSILLVIAGLVLVLAGSSWFAAAATVGVILLVVGGLLLAFEAVGFVLALLAANSVRKDIRRRF